MEQNLQAFCQAWIENPSIPIRALFVVTPKENMLSLQTHAHTHSQSVSLCNTTLMTIQFFSCQVLCAIDHCLSTKHTNSTRVYSVPRHRLPKLIFSLPLWRALSLEALLCLRPWACFSPLRSKWASLIFPYRGRTFGSFSASFWILPQHSYKLLWVWCHPKFYISSSCSGIYSNNKYLEKKWVSDVS